MIEPCTKTLKQCYFQLNYIQTLFICSKMVYSSCFSLGGNLDFLGFLQKSFITSTTKAKNKALPILVFNLAPSFEICTPCSHGSSKGQQVYFQTLI